MRMLKAMRRISSLFCPNFGGEDFGEDLAEASRRPRIVRAEVLTESGEDLAKKSRRL